MCDFDLSIILLTYNNLSNTKECIDALYKHTSNFFLTILDNASTDDTKDFLKELEGRESNVVVKYIDYNSGIIKGRNLAYDFYLEAGIKANLIMFIDNDQFVTKGWEDSYISLINKGYDIVGTEAWKLREDFYPFRKISPNEKMYSYTGCGGMIIRKKVIDKIGLFDERYAPCYFEDPDFCWRAYEAGFKTGWNPKRMIIHNHSGSLLNNDRKKYFMTNWKKFKQKWQGKYYLM